MTSPMHEGYQVWRRIDTPSHIYGEWSIDNFRMGLAVGATLSLYKYTYDQAGIEAATGYTPGEADDPSVKAIRDQYSLPGSDPAAAAEALYDYKRGLQEGLNFDWGNQKGRRARR